MVHPKMAEVNKIGAATKYCSFIGWDSQPSTDSAEKSITDLLTRHKVYTSVFVL